MQSVNKCILIGNIVADPELRRSSNGSSIVSFRLATSERWKDKQSGEKKEKAEYHSVVIFNEGLAKVAEQYLKKGSKVYLEGQIQTRKWQDKSGADRYSTEVVLQAYRGELVILNDKRDGADAPSDDNRSMPPASGTMSRVASGIMDDDIPFSYEWR